MGCKAASKVGSIVFIDAKIEKHSYINILKENLVPCVAKQYNDPEHSSYLLQEWLIYHCKQMKTPPQLPDTNPIEHICHLLEKKSTDTSDNIQRIT